MHVSKIVVATLLVLFGFPVWSHAAGKGHAADRAGETGARRNTERPYAARSFWIPIRPFSIEEKRWFEKAAGDKW